MMDRPLMLIREVAYDLLGEDDDVLSLTYNDDIYGFQLRIKFNNGAVLSANIPIRSGIKADRVEKVISMMIDRSKSYKEAPSYKFNNNEGSPLNVLIEDLTEEHEYRPNFGEGSW